MKYIKNQNKALKEKKITGPKIKFRDWVLNVKSKLNRKELYERQS